MSETPKQLVTLGTLFESNNSISDYEKDASQRKIVTENTIVYPLTQAQIDHVNKYSPNENDDDETAKEKAKWFDPELARSGLFDRIKARFSEKYLNDTVALLGYNIGKTSLKDVIDNFTVNQLLNHIFKADVNESEALFSMEKFRHRPIFCGVNVLYDPTASNEKFNNVSHKEDYFNDDWKNEYNNATYLAKSGKYDYRDITFSPTFLKDLQNDAGNPGKSDKNELIALFTRNGFSVGLSSVDSYGLGASSTIPAQYSRVFVNDRQYRPIYDYNTTLLRSKSLRLNPERSTDENKYEYLANSVVIITEPELQNEKGKKEQSASVNQLTVDHPCIVFAGETLTNPGTKEGDPKGYELATYTAVPLCSWTYFCSKESGYKDTKAIKRLEATNQCGPFTRVIAKGVYSNTISNILQTYTEIDLELGNYKDKNGKNVEVFGYKTDKKFDWENVDYRLRDAAMIEYKRLSSKNSVNDIEIYESAYYRENKNNPEHIKKLFNSTVLPLRFAFFRTGNKDVIHIRQYPATPLLGALPMQDHYITQLVPMYRNLDETPTEEKGINWYINPHDILINGVAGKFYNVSQQSYVKKTYPTTIGEGVMFTYTGHLYKGLEKDTNLPETVEAIHMGKKTSDSTVALGTIDTNLQYKTEPIMIAPNNYLRYMVNPDVTNVSTASRNAYIEFIKQGCVWRDSDGNEPEKDSVIPDTAPVNLDLSIYTDIEKSTKKTHSKSTEEPKEEVNKTSLMAGIIVIVVLLLLIAAFIIYRVMKKKKAANMGVSQGFFCGD